MHNILKTLKEFSPKQKKGYILISIPILIYADNGFLDLRITQNQTGYTISCSRDFFVDANARLEYYYNIFKNYDKNHHYDVNIKKGKLCKEYPQETNIVVAINEFIRFIIMFDDFIINNDVIGHEENF